MLEILWHRVHRKDEGKRDRVSMDMGGKEEKERRLNINLS